MDWDAAEASLSDAIFKAPASSPDSFSQPASEDLEWSPAMSEDSAAALLQQLMLRNADLLAYFKSMLQTELVTTKLATHITKEIRELGSPTNDLEDKMDAAATVLDNEEQDISNIKNELEAALLGLEEFENRACRGNLRLWGI